MSQKVAKKKKKKNLKKSDLYGYKMQLEPCKIKSRFHKKIENLFS